MLRDEEASPGEVPQHEPPAGHQELLSTGTELLESKAEPDGDTMFRSSPRLPQVVATRGPSRSVFSSLRLGLGWRCSVDDEDPRGRWGGECAVPQFRV